MITFLNDEDIERDTEGTVFNITGTISANLPDAIYKCYFIPSASSQSWEDHYAQFNSFYDF